MYPASLIVVDIMQTTNTSILTKSRHFKCHLLIVNAYSHFAVSIRTHQKHAFATIKALAGWAASSYGPNLNLTFWKSPGSIPVLIDSGMKAEQFQQLVIKHHISKSTLLPLATNK
jgi:hypothetical protein